MRLEIHHQIPNDPTLRRAWNALAESMNEPEVFYTWEWAKAVETSYAITRPPWLALAYEGNELVGVAPLMLDQRGAEFFAGTTADYCDFLSAPQSRAQFLDMVLAELRSACCQDIALANLPKDSATETALKPAAERHGFRVFARVGYECAQVRMGTPANRQELRQELRGKKWYRRQTNSLQRAGLVRLSHLTTWDAVEPVLPRFARAHVARFLSTQRLSNLIRSDRRLFLRDLACRLCGAGWFCLTRLMWGDRPIAWNYGFRFGRSWFWYQPTIDCALENYSPGKLLLTNMIIEACDIPTLQFVDLGLGAEGYKEQFADATRTTLHVTLSGSVARTVRALVRYRLTERIKRLPRAEARIRLSLARVQSVRQRLRESKPQEFASWVSSVALRSLISSAYVRFYQWPKEPHVAPSGCLEFRPLHATDLAQVAMDHEDDDDTMAYLLRAAQRLWAKGDEGFILLDAAKQPVHMCWAGEFEGFWMDELRTQLSAPAADASLIFDCWTPAAHRGKGYYAVAIAKLAELLRQQGRSPWIFSAATNASSIRGIEKAGFAYRYSITSRKTPRGQTLTVLSAEPPVEAPS